MVVFEARLFLAFLLIACSFLNILLQEAHLRENKVDEIYVTGLVTEYCVKQTVLEALRQGFKTFVIEDAVQGINAHPHDVPRAKAEMIKAGASFISADVAMHQK